MKYPHFAMLPEEAFQHIGNKKIKPHGFVGDIVDSVGDALSEATDFIGDIVSGVDSFVRENIPGGWLLPIAAVAAYTAAPLFAAEGAAEGALGAEALGESAIASPLASASIPEVTGTALDFAALPSAAETSMGALGSIADANLAGSAAAAEFGGGAAMADLGIAPSISQSLVDIGVPFDIAKNIPTIQQLASKAGINAATQLITTGKIDSESIAKSLVTGSIGSIVGGTVASNFDDKLIASIVGGAAQGATTAIANGQNPFDSAIYSSIASGLGYGLKDSGVSIPQSSVNAMVGSLAQGQSVTNALIAAGTGALGSYIAPYVKDAINNLTTQQTDQLGATSQEFTTPESIAKAVAEGTLSKQQGEDALIALQNQNALSNKYEGALSAKSSFEDIQSKYSDAVSQYNALKENYLSNFEKYNNDPFKKQYESLISNESNSANTAQKAVDSYNNLLKEYQTMTAGMDPRNIKSYADNPSSAIEELGKIVPLYELKDAQKAANEAIATYDISKKSLEEFISSNKSSINSLKDLSSVLNTQANDLGNLYSNITAQTDLNGNQVPNLYSSYQNAINSYNKSFSDYAAAQKGFYSSLAPAPVQIAAYDTGTATDVKNTDSLQLATDHYNRLLDDIEASGKTITKQDADAALQQAATQYGIDPSQLDSWMQQTGSTGNYGMIPQETSPQTPSIVTDSVLIGDSQQPSGALPSLAQPSQSVEALSSPAGSQSGALPTAQQVMPETLVEAQQPATTGLPDTTLPPTPAPISTDTATNPTPTTVTTPVTTTVPVATTVSGLPSTSGTTSGSSGSSQKATDVSQYVNPIPAYLQPTLLSTGQPSQVSSLWAGLDPKLANILTQRFAHGGSIHPQLMKVLQERGGDLVPGPENRLYMRHAKRGFAVEGPGTGQSDDIPTMLADGEYVFDADTVAALGDGSSKAGAEVLDKMREAIRAHKRSAPVDKIPPKAKSPLEYLKMAKRK
jgi:Tfp pilus assembly major pilin PilA